MLKFNPNSAYLCFLIIIYLLFKNNTVSAQSNNIKFRDIIINEILFDPETKGARFIEIYNRTDIPFNLKSCQIADLKKNTFRNIDSNVILKPHSYIVFTDDTAYIRKKYTTNNVKTFVKNKLPAWPADSSNASIVLIQNSKKIIIDSFDYNKKYHNPLLAVTEGVTLERINPDLETNNAANWQSAASIHKFATPGLPNSQFQAPPSVQAISDEIFTLPFKTFSPNDDGFQDAILLNYHFGSGDFKVTIVIYELEGRVIKKLISNEILPSEGQIKWNGETDDNLLAPIGTYIIAIEIINPDGHIIHLKKVCVLTDKI